MAGSLVDPVQPGKNVIKDDVDQMRKFKSVLITFMLLATVLFVTACSGEENPYDVNNAEGYNVSVRYDANGGLFTTNTSEIMDSYNISGMATNANGKVELSLIAPDDTVRGSKEAFTASKSGHFLAGWYTERTENGTDSPGNPIYTYSGRWDVENGLLEVDPNGSYSADEPVVTLYAAWVPLFSINFYDMGTNELLDTYTYNPMSVTEIAAPQWSETTGTLDMYKFPDAPDGYTFQAAYYDADGKTAVAEKVEHVGKLDLATATADVTTMNIYVEWMEGEWYHIYTAEQLRKNANPKGSYLLCADLDFANENWPSKFAFGDFSGVFDGNGFTIRNVTINQTSKNEEAGGLFGEIEANAVIKDVTFENVTYKLFTQVIKGTPAYGLFAGRIASGATLSNVTLVNGTLEIDSDCRIGELGSIGLVCGNGSTEGITYDLATLTAIAGGKKPDTVQIIISGETVTFVIG